MADLLTHVLFAYALFTALGWYVSWLDRRWVAVATVGAILPDLDRVDVFLPDRAIRSDLGVPFDWNALATLGGLAVLAGIGAVLFDTRRHRTRAFAALVGGGLSHLLLDGARRYADGNAGTWLYPVTAWRHPTPGLYVSTDRWLLGLAVALALVVWAAERRRLRR